MSVVLDLRGIHVDCAEGGELSTRSLVTRCSPVSVSTAFLYFSFSFPCRHATSSCTLCFVAPWNNTLTFSSPSSDPTIPPLAAARVLGVIFPGPHGRTPHGARFTRTDVGGFRRPSRVVRGVHIAWRRRGFRCADGILVVNAVLCRAARALGPAADAAGEGSERRDGAAEPAHRAAAPGGEVVLSGRAPPRVVVVSFGFCSLCCCPLGLVLVLMYCDLFAVSLCTCGVVSTHVYISCCLSSSTTLRV